MNPVARIKKEIDDIRRDTSSGVLIAQDSDNASHLIGTIAGPDDTPYAGGTFTVDITIPTDYPFSPPKMKFLTKMWHPNVSSVTGAICLDILKDQWSPALTMKTALLSLQALMCSPEPNDPQDAEVATMYKSNHERFTNTASFWTECYAMNDASSSSSSSSSSSGAGGDGKAVPTAAADDGTGSSSSSGSTGAATGGAGTNTGTGTGKPRPVHPFVKRLLDMGFEESKAREALLKNKCNEEAAVEELLASLG